MLQLIKTNYHEPDIKRDSKAEQFKELLAQRSIMLSTFYSFKMNLDENTKQLFLYMSLLSKQKSTENCLFTATNAVDLFNFIQSEHGYNNADLLCALQLKLHLNKELHQPLFVSLMSSQDASIQALASQLCLFLSTNSLQNLVISFCPSEYETLHNQCLLSLYYHKHLVSYLNSEHFSLSKLSPLNKLYLSVLSNNSLSCHDVLSQFIALKYIDSHLFEIFIISLNEAEVTQVINKMSAEDDLISVVIKTMSYSGYRKFTPFLGHFLQVPKNTLHAFNGLKLMLGDKLDQLIPLEIQLESNEEQRTKSLSYYGAKVISAWKNNNDIFAPTQMINGMNIEEETINYILQNGSQQHRYFANIHHVITSDKRVNHFNALFDRKQLLT
ncbi:hypothetical protein ACPUVO_13985 [Pseudocolwellia sp. HL-MZ19]|uniref:hypothetical protein n=1 Tax=Pseudocolwellia sp. HL-MZ19 TaxID=3400846 RepID=UPI003CF6888E